MIKIRLKLAQSVQPLRHALVPLGRLHGLYRIIGRLCKHMRVQHKCRARHDKFRISLLFIPPSQYQSRAQEGKRNKNTHMNQLRASQHALLQTRIQKIHMILQQLVNRRHLLQLRLQRPPVRL